MRKLLITLAVLVTLIGIDEQISFLVTGVFREFADASHPEETVS